MLAIETTAEGVSQRNRQNADTVLTRLGSELVTRLHVHLRVSQTYDPKNPVFQQSLQETLRTLNSFIDREGYFSLKIVKDDLFINNHRLRYSAEGFASFKSFLNQWKKRLIGEVRFLGMLDERSLKEFAAVFLGLKEGAAENAALLNEELKKREISTIEVSPIELFGDDEAALMSHAEGERETGKKVFFESIAVLKDVAMQIEAGGNADVRSVKRVVQRMIHSVSRDESVLLGLATIKNYEGYLFNHSVNTAIYSIAMGRRLGYPRDDLAEIGLTALLHDIGKLRIPPEILDKPAALSHGERGITEKHPVMGVEILLGLKELGEINPRLLLGVFDHHLRNDLSGYPKLRRKRRVSLIGRIIQIADSYDAMTTPKSYKKIPYTPHEALCIMLEKGVTHFDPILLKIFVGIVGIYPIGSLVLLDTGERGIVYSSNPDPRWLDRPKVILLQGNGHGEQGGDIADLTDTREDGSFYRTVIKTLDPNQYGVSVSRYFL